VPTLLRGDEQELGKRSRDVAFLLYGDRRAVMNWDQITTYDPDLGEPFRTRTLDRTDTDDDTDLMNAIKQFGVNGGVTQYEADEDTSEFNRFDMEIGTRSNVL
jgi:hypothetical protein